MLAATTPPAATGRAVALAARASAITIGREAATLRPRGTPRTAPAAAVRRTCAPRAGTGCSIVSGFREQRRHCVSSIELRLRDSFHTPEREEHEGNEGHEGRS